MDTVSTVSALLLAGGLGTRLRPVVQDRPKVLASVHGRPYLSYILDQLHDAGIRHAILSVGYLADLVQEAFGESYRSIILDYSREESPLGTAGAIKRALPLVKSQTTLVLNGDSYCRVDLGHFYALHLKNLSNASLVLTRVEDISRYGQVELASDSSRITCFSEKGARQGAGLINAGIYLFERILLESIPSERVVSLEQEMFPAWLKKGLQGFVIGNEFIDIGTPESYGVAEEFFRREL